MIRKGRKSLNDWFCFNFQLNNYFIFEISILGYGFNWNVIINDVIRKTKNEDEDEMDKIL